MKNSRGHPLPVSVGSGGAVPLLGGAPALLRPREKAEEARPDVLELSVASACFGRRRAR
jgi:hypothetical protein